MKMECCYPFRFWLAVLSEAVLLLVVVVYLTMGNGAGVAVFGGLAVLYALLNRSAFSFVSLDENGVTQYLLGIRQKTYAWSDIREAGVIYAKAVKRRAKGKRPSQCSLYVTPRRMNSQERLEACMDWPPPQCHWHGLSGKAPAAAYAMVGSEADSVQRIISGSVWTGWAGL